VTTATSRAAAYRRVIAEHQAAGRERDALVEAIRWLRSEANDLDKRRPRHGAVLYRQLADRIVSLAAAIPAFTPPADPPRRH
jgi:hypothetical protein